MTDISDRMTDLVRDEIELAKTEVTLKAMSLLRHGRRSPPAPCSACLPVLFFLVTIAWALDAIFIEGAGDIWLGFLIVFGVLRHPHRVGVHVRLAQVQGRPPAPTMAIDEAKRIRETVTTKKRRASLMATRSPDQIRASIEQNREQLGTSLEKLRVEVAQLTDWRTELRAHQREVLIGAGVAGFVLGGGIAALGALAFGVGGAGGAPAEPGGFSL